MASGEDAVFAFAARRSLPVARPMTHLARTLAIVWLTVLLAAPAGSAARALEFRDIAGKWCGEVSSYVLARDTLTVILLSDHSKRVYPIDSYEYDDAVIAVTWKRGDEPLITEFGEFGADDRSMTQLENDVGPRREFRRCS